MKEDMGQILGVPQEVIEKVFRKKTSGFVQTPQGEVKIQRLKPGEKPILPAVRVLWNDDTEKQDFFSFAAAAKELKIDPKTIPHALRAGRDSFTRKSDGKKFTIEIPGEKTRLKPKPLSEEEKAKRAEAKRRRMIAEEYMTRCHKISSDQTPFEEMERVVESMRARDEESMRVWDEERERKKNQPPKEKEESSEEKKEPDEEKEDTAVEPPGKLKMGLWEKEEDNDQNSAEETPEETPEENSAEETPEETPEENSAEETPEETPEENSAEETSLKEEDLVYLGMGLWEKKKPDEKEEEDPFVDWVYEEHCPRLGKDFDIIFGKEKNNLLRPGEKVVKFVEETEKESRVIIVDCDFKFLQEFPPEDFEDSFLLAEVCPQDCEKYISKYVDVGMLPIYDRRLSSQWGKSYIWRIKVCEKENKN